MLRKTLLPYVIFSRSTHKQDAYDFSAHGAGQLIHCDIWGSIPPEWHTSFFGTLSRLAAVPSHTYFSPCLTKIKLWGHEADNRSSSAEIRIASFLIRHRINLTIFALTPCCIWVGRVQCIRSRYA